MNTNNFFKLCKENGVDVAEVTTSKSKSFEFSIFKNELENYKISTSGKTIARGIYNNKLGFCSTEKDDKTTPSYLVKNIISSARYIEKDEEPIIFSGSEKYHKKNVYNKELGLDGESMSDWFTGSGCVLIKVLLLCAFGIKADFNSLKIEMPKTLAFDKMSAKLNLKGGEITIIYENRRDGNAKKTNTANGETREFYVDGKRVDSVCLSNADIAGKALKVEIID